MKQPIETAPRDGTRILVLSKEYKGMENTIVKPQWFTAEWNPDGSSWVEQADGSIDLEPTGNWSSGTGWFQPDEVTHWHPLPPV